MSDHDPYSDCLVRGLGRVVLSLSSFSLVLTDHAVEVAFESIHVSGPESAEPSQPPIHLLKRFWARPHLAAARTMAESLPPVGSSSAVKYPRGSKELVRRALLAGEVGLLGEAERHVFIRAEDADALAHGAAGRGPGRAAVFFSAFLTDFCSRSAIILLLA